MSCSNFLSSQRILTNKYDTYLVTISQVDTSQLSITIPSFFFSSDIMCILQPTCKVFRSCTHLDALKYYQSQISRAFMQAPGESAILRSNPTLKNGDSPYEVIEG